MATFYLDHLGGNDSNNGTTFANRWKTITSGATAARLAPGDTIRIMQSGMPTTIGNATWTSLSSTVTLENELTKNIEMCNTAWTPSTNISYVEETTSQREGSACETFVVGSSFTTGLMAYKNLGSAQDFSNYQQISFWIYTTVAIAANTLKLSLCSGTNGTTEVNQFVIPAMSQTLNWHLFTLDYGGALGSSIQSVGLFALLDPGTPTIYLDCIIACKANSAENSLTMSDLIGKNTTDEGWWAIRSINGTTLILEMTNSRTIPQLRGYSGDSGKVETYKIKTIPMLTYTAESIQDDGSFGLPITFSGGWDTTNMTSQTGMTFLDGICSNTTGISTNGKDFITLDKLNTCRFNIGLNIGQSTYWTNILTDFYSCACKQSSITIEYSYNYNFNNVYLNQSHVGLEIINSPAKITFQKLICNCHYDKAMQLFSGSNIKILSSCIIKNSTVGIWFGTFYDVYINNLTLKDNSKSFTMNTFKIKNIYFKNAIIYDSILFDSSLVQTDTYINMINYNNTSGDHRLIAESSQIIKETGSDRHTLDGIAWKLSSTNSSNTEFIQFNFKIAQIECEANQQITIQAWAKKDTACTAKLFIRGRTIKGVDSDTYSNSIISNNTYELLTLNFTPTEYSTATIYFISYGTGIFNTFIDDITITKT